jgi:hypothetical protein
VPTARFDPLPRTLFATGGDRCFTQSIEAGAAAMKLIAPSLGEIKGSEGKTIKVDRRLPTRGSVFRASRSRRDRGLAAFQLHA